MFAYLSNQEYPEGALVKRRKGYVRSRVYCVQQKVCGQQRERETEVLRVRFFTLFEIAFSLLIGFSASLEGSVIKLKPAALVPQDTAVSLKA